MECHLEIKHPKFFLSCSIVLHIIGCAHFVAALALFFKCITASSDRELFKAAFQHLSVWSCSIHAVYCLFALVTDGLILILTLTDESTSLYVRRSFMRACLAFPSAMFSNANIWIITDIIYSTIPTYIFHMTNTNLIIYEILDFLFCNAQNPKMLHGTILVFTFVIVYVVCMEEINAYHGVFVYPYIGSMSLPRRIFMYCMGLLIFYMFYLMGKFINRILWDYTTLVKLCNYTYFRHNTLQESRAESRATASKGASLVKIFSASFKRSYSAPRTEFQAKQKAEKDSKKNKERLGDKKFGFFNCFKNFWFLKSNAIK
ncbi:uncharacterized protein LOC106671027 [Cimex lectularius]|uniref:Uncharacterized protein n=1 Tax=Cimex lectularius TaxID=79782 RepID=A0A8I6S6V7_CIMLE|nr:uncharacterized protein LOC106671027 [Cimex lectularius]